MSYTVCAVICAAGKGTRAGFAKNKLLLKKGFTVLEKTLRAFDYPSIHEIIVTSSKENFNEISEICQAFPTARAVLGGETRLQSVKNALEEVQSDLVLIHDGARPFVTREVIENCIQSVKAYGSGICAVECRDTVAQTDGEYILSVPNRNALRQIQTPQGFFTENIRSAYRLAFEREETDFTDDSSVFARFCGKPRLCAGDSKNTKLTYPEDFEETVRCGFGVDTHAFGKEQPYIVLAGVKIPSESGLIAHSDGDVLVHAVMDALLSAAGLRDIGYYFPDSDEKWRNANSMEMLSTVLALIDGQGYAVKNISIAVQTERPRLAKYIEAMQNSLSGVLRIDPTAIGITAGTNEGLGYIGEGKGITVNAYALLKSIK